MPGLEGRVWLFLLMVVSLALSLGVRGDVAPQEVQEEAPCLRIDVQSAGTVIRSGCPNLEFSAGEQRVGAKDLYIAAGVLPGPKAMGVWIDRLIGPGDIRPAVQIVAWQPGVRSHALALSQVLRRVPGVECPSELWCRPVEHPRVGRIQVWSGTHELLDSWPPPDGDWIQMRME